MKPILNTIRTFFKGASAKHVKMEDLSPKDIVIAYVISRSYH